MSCKQLPLTGLLLSVLAVFFNCYFSICSSFSFTRVHRNTEVNEVEQLLCVPGRLPWVLKVMSCVFFEFPSSVSYPYCPNLCPINNKYSLTLYYSWITAQSFSQKTLGKKNSTSCLEYFIRLFMREILL